MSNKTIVIVDHPSFDTSRVNRRFVEELRRYPEEISVHNLQSSYPAGSIDPIKEHSIIDNHGSIVLQFPLYWFNSPVKMKQWLETVFTGDWAFKKGHHLKGKKIALCVTCGSEEAAYTKEGRHHRSVEDYLANYIRAFEMCDAEYAGLFAYYGINDKEALSVEALAKASKDYVDFVKALSV